MRKFRHWEGALAAAGIAVCLARSLKMDGDQQRPSWLNLGVLAFGAGVLSLFSEAGALACYGIIGWLALRRRGWLGFVADGRGFRGAILRAFVSLGAPQ